MSRSYGQTKHGNGNYLAGLLIALELNGVYIWEQLLDHTRTHMCRRKKITNEMVFDVEWISIPAHGHSFIFLHIVLVLHMQTFHKQPLETAKIMSVIIIKNNVS